MSDHSAFGGGSGGGIYCRIAAGKVCRKANENDPGAVKVEKRKNGKGTGEFKYELQNKEVSGRITGFKSNTHPQYGTTLTVVIETGTGEEPVNVQMGEGDRYWRAFMTRLPNIDIKKPITFAPYDFLPAGESKRKIGLNLFQGGAKIPSKYTKDFQGDMPPPERPMVKGVQVWDFYAQDQWLNNNVLLPIAVQLGGMKTTTQTAKENPPDGYMDQGDDEGENMEDAPF